jgi:hypothetical protein
VDGNSDDIVISLGLEDVDKLGIFCALSTKKGKGLAHK